MIGLRSAQTSPEFAPRLQSLATPDPDTGRDAADERHEVFEHENQVDGLLSPLVGLLNARTRECRHPVIVEIRFVEVAGNHDRGGDSVEHAEDSYSDHELLEFVGLRAGTDSALLFDDRADAEERNEPSKQESRANHQIHEVRRQHKVPEMFD